jgi:hypothetical protein
MANLMPVNQVTAVKNRPPGKIFEGRSDKIVIIPDPADGRIRVTAWQDRVAKRFAQED